MKRPELRPYQAEAGAKINATIAAGHRRVLLVSPTGSGKTVIAAAMIDQGGLEPGTPRAWQSLPPLDPEPHVRAWVSARARAFAKSQSRGAT